MPLPTIGFIGLGIMGKPMASNLMKAGYPLVVHNRSQGAVAELSKEGARAAGSPQEVAAQSEVVILMLPDSPDVEAVVFEPDGISQGFREMLRVVRPGGRVVCLEISHPPGRIFGSLFNFYFYKLAPLFGTIIGKAFEEYNYLPNSLTTFPDAPTLQQIMVESGWSDTYFTRLNGGIVAIHVGTKP